MKAVASIAVALLIVSATPALALTARPTLGLSKSADPLVVRGTHFKGREHVRVIVSSAGRSWTKRVVAGTTGAFTVSFGTVAADRCSLVARAFGSSGDRASAKPAETGCPEPISP